MDPGHCPNCNRTTYTVISYTVMAANGTVIKWHVDHFRASLTEVVPASEPGRPSLLLLLWDQVSEGLLPTLKSSCEEQTSKEPPVQELISDVTD